jgi:hypothetical protein
MVARFGVAAAGSEGFISCCIIISTTLDLCIML